MNGNEVNTQKSAKKHLASYSIWYRVVLGIMALTALCYALALVGWITGHTATLFFGIEGLFLEDAMQTPFLWLYINYYGIAASALLIVLAVFQIFACRTDKESAFLKIRTLMGCVIGSVWGLPLFHAVVDMAVVAMRIRTKFSYDFFDFNMNFIPSVIVTVVAIAVLLVNGKLGEVPADAEIE